MANARRLARERKALKKAEQQALKEAEVVAKPKPKPMPVVEPELEEPPEDDEEQHFVKWLSNMDKFAAMSAKVEKKRAEEVAKAEAKERALEEKYFKKFQEQQQTKKTMPKPKEHEPLIEKETYGDYSNYF